MPFALGTETGGSVVGPAALCGVTGFRPTPGRLSRRGMLTLSPTLDKPGVLARSAVDCGFVLGLLADTVVPTAQPAEVGTVRVGLVEDEAVDWDSDIVESLDRAVAVVDAICATRPLHCASSYRWRARWGCHGWS